MPIIIEPNSNTLMAIRSRFGSNHFWRTEGTLLRARRHLGTMVLAREHEGEIAVAESLPGWSLPGCYHGFRPIMHPAHEAHCEASAFSDAQYGLCRVRNECLSLPLALDMAEG